MPIKRSGFVVACLSLMALGSSAIQQDFSKPFDAKSEVPATRKLIEAKYAILSDAIFLGDDEKADDVTHGNLEIYDAFTGKPEDSWDDESDYLNAIAENDVVLSAQKARMEGLGATLKVDRKLTQFMSGRKLASGVYVETMTGEMVDVEGQFGDKGKKIKIETQGTFYDQWVFDESDDKDGVDWYLKAREATSFFMKVNGKVVDLEIEKSDD